MLLYVVLLRGRPERSAWSPRPVRGVLLGAFVCGGLYGEGSQRRQLGAQEELAE